VAVAAAASAVGDVMACDMLRIRGLSIIGVPGSDMGDDSSVSSSPWIYPDPHPRGPGVGTESSSYSISRTSNDNPLSVAVLAVLAVLGEADI
jgi:hypothetical protein